MITIRIGDEDFQKIIAGISKLPFEDVASLYMNLTAQAQMQEEEQKRNGEKEALYSTAFSLDNHGESSFQKSTDNFTPHVECKEIKGE